MSAELREWMYGRALLAVVALGSTSAMLHWFGLGPGA
jgi:hypothetical protein